MKNLENGSTSELMIELDQLRLSQDFSAEGGVIRKITTVPVSKPRKDWWCRVLNDPKYQLITRLIEDSHTNQVYLLGPTVQGPLADESYKAVLYTGITRLGDPFLWPVRLPEEEKINPRMQRHFRSVMDAIELAKSEWIRVKWNRALGAYDSLRTERKLPEPKWPEESLAQLINIAFRDFYITSLNHPVVEALLHGI